MVDHVHPRTRTTTTATGLTPDRGAGDASAGFGCLFDTAPIVTETLKRHELAEIVVLRMVGEIDLATQATMGTALRGGLQARPRHLLIDLSAVRFCGAHGFNELTDTGRRAAEGDIGYALCGLSPHLRRVATMLWGRDGPTRYRSLAAAVTTIRAGHARHERAHKVSPG